jgi:hypothetical protein
MDDDPESEELAVENTLLADSGEEDEAEERERFLLFVNKFLDLLPLLLLLLFERRC